MSFVPESRWSDVVVASAAQLLGGMATFLVMVTQMLAFQQRGASGLEVAALAFCEALPVVALGRPIGRLVDRVDSRLLLVAGGLGAAAACLALAEVDSLVGVLVGVTALSASAGVSIPARQALIPAMVVRDDLPRANAIGSTAGSLGMMGGPALAGFLVGGIGPHATVRWAALGWLATVVLAFAIRTRRSAGPKSVASPATEDSGWNLGRDPLLRMSVWGLTAVITAASVVNVVLVFFVMGTLGSRPEAYGVIDASWMVGMLAGAWLVSLTIRATTVDTAVAHRLLSAAAVVCAAILATGSMNSPWWIVPCYLVGGAGNAAINVCGGTLLGRRVPAEARGRANTAMSMRVQAGSLVGFVAGGLLLVLFEPRWIVIGCGIVGLAIAGGVLPLVRRLGTETATVTADRTVTV
jgi:MFS family permease